MTSEASIHSSLAEEASPGPAHATPPGPKLSSQEQARLWLEAPVDLLESCQRDFGDLFTLRLGAFGTIVIVSDPEGVRRVFGAPPDSHECRHFNESYRYVMGPHALFLKDGDEHRRLKRMLAPELRGDRLSGQAAEVCRVTRDAMREWGQGGEVRLRPLMHEIALRCVLRLVLGDDRDAPREQVVGWFRSNVWRDLRSWKPWTNLSRLHPALRDLLSAELALRRGGTLAPRASDLLDALLAARDENGTGLLDEEIQDQVLMLSITAGDAVAVATSWALHRAATNPLVQETLRDEARAMGEAPDPVRLAEQPMLAATCKEILRLHPVLPTVSGRRSTSALEFMGYQLDAGMTLAPCEYLVHRRADIFEQPLAFRPERFLGRSYAPHEYFPFGGAHRACLGSALAPLTLKLVLATVLSQYRLEAATPEAPRVVRLGTLLAPEEELALRVSRLS